MGSVMRPSIRLGTVSGIPIGLHWSIAVLAGLFTLGLAGTILPQNAPGYTGALYLITAAVVAVGLMASIIAHELGHSLVAQRNRVGVRSINLFALGGVASLERDPDDPGAAARIALAGPAVSVVLGLGALITAGLAGAVGAPALAVVGLTWLGIVNLVMAVFNMLPALPLDGGRALQAYLWRRNGDRNQATITAANIGRRIGWAIALFGLWQFLTGGSGLWTVVIGWFIISSAKAEGMRARWMARRQEVAGHWPFTGWDQARWAWAGDGDRRAWEHPGPMPPPPQPRRPWEYPAPTDDPSTRPSPPPPRPDDVIDVEGHRIG